MPVFLFTYHAHATWLPDREEGFVKRGEGIIEANEEDLDAYYREMSQPIVYFHDREQRILIAESRVAAEKQMLRLHSVATESTHIHTLVSWKDERSWFGIRNGIKQSYTRKLNTELRRCRWFCRGASRRQVQDETHLLHLMKNYLPSHSGWKWMKREEVLSKARLDCRF